MRKTILQSLSHTALFTTLCIGTWLNAIAYLLAVALCLWLILQAFGGC